MYPKEENLFFQNMIDKLIKFDILRLDTAMLFILFYMYNYKSKITINKNEIIFTLDRDDTDFEDFNIFIRIFQFITTTNTLTYYNKSDNSWHLNYKHLQTNYKNIFGSKLVVDQ